MPTASDYRITQSWVTYDNSTLSDEEEMTISTYGEATLQLSHDAVMKTVKAIPPLPPSVTRLNSLFADPDHRISDVVRTVELDPAVCGRLLKMANGTNHGPGKVSSVGEAVVRLGGGTVRSVAIGECLRPAVDLDLSPFGLTPESYWEHTAAVVCFAEELLASRVAEFGGDLPVAAVLHDFGKIVLAAHLTTEHVPFLNQDYPDVSASDIQRAILGLDHAEVGAAVAQGWELSEDLVKATQYHHEPEVFDHPLCHGLCIANELALQLGDMAHDARSEMNLDTSIEALRINQQQLSEIAEKGAVRFENTLESYR